MKHASMPQIAFRVFCVSMYVCVHIISDNVFTLTQPRVQSWILCSRLIQACSTIQVNLSGCDLTP